MYHLAELSYIVAIIILINTMTLYNGLILLLKLHDTTESRWTYNQVQYQYYNNCQ